MSHTTRTGEYQPTVAVIIAAHNEAECIEQTIKNKLQQQYPTHLLKVIVVSDDSSDETDQIVEQLMSNNANLHLIQQVPRQGKTAALNRAYSLVSSDILVFSDANSMYELNALDELVKVFADPKVGYATGRMIYTDTCGVLVGDGVDAYMRFETFLWKSEMAVGSIVGVNGGIDAMRRELFEVMNVDQLPDFVLPLSVIERGYRVVYCPEAILHEEPLDNSSSEFKMRVRVSLRALWAIHDKRKLLNIKRFPMFTWQLISHKLMRYLSFLPLGLVVVLSILYAKASAASFVLAILVLAFFAMALAGFSGPGKKHAIFRYCHFFLLLNLANATASLMYVRGKKIVVWQPRLG
jgi:cellulose synthase/poly-beta-1,6-N-acetylglucosamine synthase-like glycosyltransferase